MNLRDILFRTFPHSLLDPADLRVVSRRVGREGLDAYKQQHFLAAQAWLELFEGPTSQSALSDGSLICQAAALRIGINKRRSETVKRLIHLLSESALRAARRTIPRSVRSDPGSAHEQPKRLGPLIWAASGDPAFVESARQWIRQRYLPALPGVIARFCYFADSWCPKERKYQDQVLASRFGPEAADLVQREALWTSLVSFLETPVTCMIAELNCDRTSAAWLGPQVLRACNAEFPLPVSILAASKVEFLFLVLRS